MKEQSAELKRAKKKIGDLESELNKAKLSLTAIDQLKEDLAGVEQVRDASYASATQVQNKAAAAEAALAELQAVACDVYKRVFDRGQPGWGQLQQASY